MKNGALGLERKLNSVFPLFKLKEFSNLEDLLHRIINDIIASLMLQNLEITLSKIGTLGLNFKSIKFST